VTTPATPEGGLTAALLQLAELRTVLGQIDAREAGHWVVLQQRLRESAETLAGMAESAGLAADLATTVDDLSGRVDALEDPGLKGKGYVPVPSPRWWDMGDDDRELALARLRSWVTDIYRPGMGKTAAKLARCWDEHPACLYILDWLSELWSVLYLQPSRSASLLAGQAEWWVRQLEAAAEFMARETAGCEHRLLNGARR
jgi:hypothetical protein